MSKLKKSNLDKLIFSTDKIKQLTVENPNHFKTSRLGQSMSNYSNQLEREIQGKRRRNRVFPYGTLVYVDFGINFGSEFSAPHYAITLSKEDKKNRNTITVIPLTSKPGYDNLPLEFNLAEGLGILTTRLINEAEDKVENELVAHFGEYDDFDELIAKLEKEGRLDEKERAINLVQKLADNVLSAGKRLEKYVSDLDKTTYAKLDSITTIDKVKIFKKINPLGGIGVAQILEPQMKILSDEIKTRYLI